MASTIRDVILVVAALTLLATVRIHVTPRDGEPAWSPGSIFPAVHAEPADDDTCDSRRG